MTAQATRLLGEMQAGLVSLLSDAADLTPAQRRALGELLCEVVLKRHALRSRLDPPADPARFRDSLRAALDATRAHAGARAVLLGEAP